jgi:hypothetical protein
VTPLRLTADDPGVWARTLTAIAARPSGRPVKVRCAGGDRHCGTQVAVITENTWGPLFVANWDAPSRLPTETYNDGVRLSRRAVLNALTQVSGPAEDWRATDGTIALLTLPPDIVSDVPDLMVRCPSCGDAVIARAEALQWLRTQTTTATVTTAMPRLAYAYGSALSYNSRSRTRHQAHHGTAAMTLEQANEWLGWNALEQEDFDT